MDSLKNTAGQHTDEQKQQFYNSLPEEQKKKQSYTDWVKEAYHDQYEKWVPWLEDQYLKWFGKGDNKASYATKDTLNKSKVTGVKQVDQIQDDVHNLVGNQVGTNGTLSSVGNIASKEGVNRAERGGKDDKGSYINNPEGDSIINKAKGAGSGIAGGAQTAGSSLAGGANSVGQSLGLSSGQK